MHANVVPILHETVYIFPLLFAGTGWIPWAKKTESNRPRAIEKRNGAHLSFHVNMFQFVFGVISKHLDE